MESSNQQCKPFLSSLLTAAIHQTKPEFNQTKWFFKRNESPKTRLPRETPTGQRCLGPIARQLPTCGSNSISGPGRIGPPVTGSTTNGGAGSDNSWPHTVRAGGTPHEKTCPHAGEKATLAARPSTQVAGRFLPRGERSPSGGQCCSFCSRGSRAVSAICIGEACSDCFAGQWRRNEARKSEEPRTALASKLRP